MKTLACLVIACLIAVVSGLPSSQIIGGVDARDGMYLYQASVRYDDEYRCSGAIISTQYVITVAQCVYGYENPYKFNVIVGSNSLNKPGAIYRVKALLVHSGYNRSLRIHDIALIHVTEHIKFNENVQPIALPITNHDYSDFPFVITGWKGNKLEPTENKLQEIIVRGYAQDKCNEEYRGMIRESQVCVIVECNDEGISNEDIGDPVVTDDVLVGLVSYTEDYANANVCTRIFYYRSWISRYAGI